MLDDYLKPVFASLDTNKSSIAFFLTLQIMIFAIYRFFNQISNEFYNKNTELRLPSSLLDKCVKLTMIIFIYYVFVDLYHNQQMGTTAIGYLLYFRRVMLLVTAISVLSLDYYAWFILAPLGFENSYLNQENHSYWVKLIITVDYKCLILFLLYGLTLKPFSNYKNYRLMLINSSLLVFANIAIKVIE